MCSKQLQHKPWGLYTKDAENAIPLKNLDISIKIFHNIAQVTYSQDYFNNTDLLLETEFFFPISPDACFDSFQAAFNDITIKGVVKEKNIANMKTNRYPDHHKIHNNLPAHLKFSLQDFS